MEYIYVFHKESIITANNEINGKTQKKNNEMFIIHCKEKKKDVK